MIYLSMIFRHRSWLYLRLSYDVCNYIVYNHPSVSYVQSSYSHHVIFKTAQKAYDTHAISLPVPYDYLKSLPSVLAQMTI